MKTQPRYKLKLSRLDFVSPVDVPAQETAKVLLIKRGTAGPSIDGYAQVAKVDEELGLVFCWAFTSTTADGDPYHDLQGDAIDPDFVKAAADFMLRGGQTDEMHDGEPDGRVVFAMPMTPEIAKAFGVVTKQVGLMIALKPSAAVLAKFKAREYTAVSIAGLGEREAVKAAKSATAPRPRVVKQGVLTSETEGHVHSLCVEDPGCEWMDTLSTNGGTSEGASAEHWHAWTYDAATGAITIAADSGHTHTVDAVVPPAVLAIAAGRAALRTIEQAAGAAAIGAAIVEEALEGAATGSLSISISARAPRGNSTPGPARANVASHQEQTSMPILRKHLAAAFLLPELERAHAVTLTEETDLVAFLEKSTAERAAIVKSAQDADPIVHTATDGTVIRKSHGETALALAKRADAQEALLKVQSTEIAKATAETERVTLEKRATIELGHFSKGAVAGLDVRTVILKALDGIPDAAQRAEALVVMKGANAAMKMLYAANGVNPEQAQGAPGTKAEAFVALEQGLAKFAKASNIPDAVIWTDGYNAFARTADGAALVRTYEELSAQA